jgi:fused signal recognition particle receptor
MENEGFSQNLFVALQGLSNKFGSGQVVPDVLTAATVLSLFSLFLALYSYRRASVSKSMPDGDKINAIGMRVEKIEATVKELRTEWPRFLEQFRGDIGFLKQEVLEIRKLLMTMESPQGPSGGGGFGGPSQGGTGSFSGGFGGPPSSGGGTGFRASTAITAPPQWSAPDPVGDPYPPRSSTSYEPPPPPAQEQERTPVETGPASVADRLRTSRRGILEKIRGVFAARTELNPEMADELEVLLVTSDLGVKTVRALLDEVKQEVVKGEKLKQDAVIRLLKQKMVALLTKDVAVGPIVPARQEDGPLVVMVVGVNGVGKTTTVAKLANMWRIQGAKVMLAAADTFRAAAYEQLKEWAERVGVPVVGGVAEQRPSTVVFDAMVEAKRQEVDVLIIDTAGRLHTKSNLMLELEGIRNIMTRHQPAAPHETFLVVDGTNGQNAVAQAKEFHAAVPLTGLVVTKLDGTAKGGVVIPIKDELGIPIRYIGVGESWADLRPFNATEFVDALFDSGGEASDESAHAEERKQKRRDAEAELLM